MLGSDLVDILNEIIILIIYIEGHFQCTLNLKNIYIIEIYKLIIYEQIANLNLA